MVGGNGSAGEDKPVCVFTHHHPVLRGGHTGPRLFFDARQFRVLMHDFNPMLLEAAIDFSQEKHLTRHF